MLSTFKINDIYSQVDIFEPPTWFESLINAIMSLFGWNNSPAIDTPMDTSNEDDFYDDPNIDWENPIIIDDLCLDWDNC